MDSAPIVVGGRYGLGSKDTRPAQIAAVYRNLRQEQPLNGFTLGIIDDVTHTSLVEGEAIDTTPPAGTISCKFWGPWFGWNCGGRIRVRCGLSGNIPICLPRPIFLMTARNRGGTTISHLRFGPKPIKAPYLVDQADYIACHNPAFVNNYDLLAGGIKEGGRIRTELPMEIR